MIHKYVKAASFLMALCMAVSLTPCSRAEAALLNDGAAALFDGEGALSLTYSLDTEGAVSSGGRNILYGAAPGDVVTVTFTITREEAEEPYRLSTLQNEIQYDMAFFELVEGSQRAVYPGADVLHQRRASGQRIVKCAAMSGSPLSSEQAVCTFQLRILSGAAGSGAVRCTNAKASDAAYKSAEVTAGDLIVSLSGRPASDALGVPVREGNRVRVFCETSREDAKLAAALFLPGGQWADAVIEDAPPVSGERVLTFPGGIPEGAAVRVFLLAGEGMVPLCQARETP